MDPSLRTRLESFVKPLYQDLDGVSRLDEVERIGAIARHLFEAGSSEESLDLELLILFHRLGGWLGRLGNASRVSLASGGMLKEESIHRLISSLERLERPESRPERAVASAIAIEEGGIRGAIHRLANARREGQTLGEQAREIETEAIEPAGWMDPRAAAWLARRTEAARAVARNLRLETELADLEGPVSDKPSSAPMT